MDDQNLYCPIGGDLMWEPAATPCGHTFELKEILRWLRRSDACPVCNQRGIRMNLINKVVTLREIIRNYAKRQGIQMTPVHPDESDLQQMKNIPTLVGAPPASVGAPSAPPAAPAVEYIQPTIIQYSLAASQRLFTAVQNNSLQIARQALAQGGDPNHAFMTTVGKEFDCTSLILAVMNKNIKMVKLLLANGGDPNQRGEKYGNSLHFAIANKNVDIVRVLLANGAFPNFDDRSFPTHLQTAVQNRSKEIISLLLEASANPNKFSAKDEETPLLHAIEADDHDIIRILLDGGAHMKYEYKRKGSYTNEKTTVHRCAMYHCAEHGRVACAKILKERGLAPTEHDFNMACRKSHLEFMEFIINNNNTINMDNAFIEAIENRNKKSVAFLLKNGVSANLVIKGKSALMSAAGYYHNPEVISLLLENGADPNYVSPDGSTALSKAVTGDNIRILKPKTTVRTKSGCIIC